MNTPNRPSNDPRSDAIADRLQRHVTTVELDAGDVAGVVSRGRQRRQRRQVAVALCSVAAVGAGAVVAVEVLTRPETKRVIIASPSSSADSGSTSSLSPTTTNAGPAAPPSSVPPIELVDSNLVWNRVDPASSEAIGVYPWFSQSSVVGDGPYLAWSTAPGRTDSYQGRVWRSDDGVSWEMLDEIPGLSVGALASANGRFYAYGTTPGATEGGPSVPVLASSDDDGSTWSTAPLPIDVADLEADPMVERVISNVTSVAAGPNGLMVSVVSNVAVNLECLLPSAWLNSGWTFTGDGMTKFEESSTETTSVATVAATEPAEPGATTTTIMDAPEMAPASTVPGPVSGTVPVMTCDDGPAVAPDAVSVTWAELGISPAVGAALQGGRVSVFRSDDGQSFTPVAAPAADRSAAYGLRLIALDEGFAAITNGPSAALHRTVDGSSWIAESLPVQSIESAAVTSDRIAVVGYDNAQSAVLAVQVDGTWTTTPMGAFVRPDDGASASMSGGSVVIGSTGITVLSSIWVDAILELGGVETEVDGVILRMENGIGLMSFLDATDRTVLGSIDQSNNVAQGAIEFDGRTYSVTVTRLDGTEVLIDLGAAQGPIWDQVTAAGLNVPRPVVLHSIDGVQWSRELATDIAGAPVLSADLRQVGNSVLVGAYLRDERNPDGTLRQTVLIGTPRT
jgi:hypothetical protein